jgi:hypothetical protein
VTPDDPPSGCHLTVVSHGNGYTVPDEGYYEEDEQVTITAFPDSGYHVEQWVVDGELYAYTENSITLAMDASHTVNVYFTNLWRVQFWVHCYDAGYYDPCIEGDFYLNSMYVLNPYWDGYMCYNVYVTEGYYAVNAPDPAYCHYCEEYEELCSIMRYWVGGNTQCWNGVPFLVDRNLSVDIWYWS